MNSSDESDSLNFSPSSAPSQSPSTFKSSMKLLLKSEPSLFLIILINFSTSAQYYILVTLIPLYFSFEHNFSDLESGLVFGVFGIVIGISSLYLSSIMHSISFKRGLYFSFQLGIIGFYLMLQNHPVLSVISVLLFQSISCSMAWPYAEYGLKEYSNVKIQNLASSCFFMSNYLAGAIIGGTIDTMWIYYEDKSFVYNSMSYIGIGALLISSVCLYFCRDLENMKPEDLDADGIWKLKRFWRFVLLIFLLTLLRSTSFGHLDATLPKYLTRVQGPNAHFGIMLTIHSCTMMLGLFIFTGLTYMYSSFTLMIIGALFGALGSIFIIISSELGAFVLFVVFISIGESIWVPRLLDYTYSVVPDGKEGLYLAMSNCPFYFGMILTGTSSGLLFNEFCPDNDNIENCPILWTFVFFASLIISFSMLVLKRTILGPGHENYDRIFCFRDSKKN